MSEIEIDGVRHRIVVDHELCMGNRVCQVDAPQVFRVDDDTNLSETLGGEVDPSLAPAVREAVVDCPQDAIRLEPIV